MTRDVFGFLSWKVPADDARHATVYGFQLVLCFAVADLSICFPFVKMTAENFFDVGGAEHHRWAKVFVTCKNDESLCLP